ncbi:MAG: esterase family protein [Verrucomicrobia bacterium]|nr:esterase family protein [Verrucomicrobiota bacterium]
MKSALFPLLALLLAATVSVDAQTETKSKKGGTTPEGQRPRDQTPSWLMPEVKGANLHYKTFDSKAAGEKVSYLLYLPPGYETSKAMRYPVVYWLHGIGGSQQGVPVMAERLTKAITEGKTPAMIVVYVNGMIRGGWSDAQFPVETVTIKELLPLIDATYRTIATREGRMIEGFSMGGSGAARWGFKYPDLFCSISIIDGALRVPGDAVGSRPAEAPKPAEAKPPVSGKKGPPDSTDTWKLAELNAEKMKGRTTIRIVTRTTGLGGANEKFHDHLDSFRLEHEFHKIPDAPHSPNPLYEGLGEKNWPFYVKAFSAANSSK